MRAASERISSRHSQVEAIQAERHASSREVHTSTKVLKHFKAVSARTGRPDACFHDLRHTYAVVSLQKGDDVKPVQQNFGHATASFTLDVYGHVSEKMEQESARRMENFITKIKA